MRARQTWSRVLIGGFAAAALLVVTACGSISASGGGSGGSGAAETGITADSIVLGMASPLTGPSSSLGIDGRTGAEVFVKWINDQGGVNGRKLDLRVQDTAFDPQKHVAAARYLIDQEKVFAVWGDVGSDSVAAVPVFDQTGVPFLFPYALAIQMINPVHPSTFTIVATSYTQEQALSNHLAPTLPADAKIGILALNSADGQDATNGFKAGAAGPKVVATQQYERGATNWQPQLVALKAAGVTHVVLHASDAWMAEILKEAQALGFDAQFYGSTGTISTKLFELAGNDLVEGKGAVSITAAPDDATVPGVKEFLDATAKYAPGYKPNTYALHSWVTGKIMVAAMQQCGQDLTRTCLVDKLNGTKDFDTQGITGPISFSPDNHLGTNQVLVMKAVDGHWVPQTGFVGPGAGG